MCIRDRHYTAANSGWRCASEFDGRGTVKVTGVEAPDAQTVVYLSLIHI